MATTIMHKNLLIASRGLSLKRQRKRSERRRRSAVMNRAVSSWIGLSSLLVALLIRPSDLCLAFTISPLENTVIRGKHQRLWESTRREEKHEISSTDDDQQQPSAKKKSSISVSPEEASISSSTSSETEVPELHSKQPPVVAGRKQKMELMWCEQDGCTESIRERAVGEHNHIVLRGPATGQVAYYWSKEGEAAAEALLPKTKTVSPESALLKQQPKQIITHCVLILVKQGSANKALLDITAQAVTDLTNAHSGVHILLDAGTKAHLEEYPAVDKDKIHVFEPVAIPGFGDNLNNHNSNKNTDGSLQEQQQQQARRVTDLVYFDDSIVEEVPLPEWDVDEGKYRPDLIVTLGGDGLLMHAGMLFQGPTPPILCVSGGSLGFLTPFQADEMAEAVQVALGLISSSNSDIPSFVQDIEVYPPNMPSYPYEPLAKTDSSGKKLNFSFGQGDRICLSIRMRLDCRIIDREGSVRARYNVLNEVVIDRGISPYLAALECFCDDVHLTTVQADGIIFATPTGSTAYSLAAGSSVVHPAVPCILVTPICPHVLSFRSMVFPDHVVLRCYVPDDARAEASVAFDGKHRQELHRGDSVQIQLSEYPVPTINRKDHSADWLYGLKHDFNFNARTRQGPL